MQSEFFEWDNEKAAINLCKHGVEFEEAKTVFEDPFALELSDDVHSDEENRWVVLGLSLLARVLLVVHTERSERIRIISARQATPFERAEYEQRRKF